MKTRLLAAFALAASFSSVANSATVFADGKEWMQVIDSFNISYNSMSNNCSVTTGACSSGNIGGVALSGWTWADTTDLVSLFDSYIGTEAGVQDGSSTTQPYLRVKIDSDFAPLFSQDFDPTKNTQVYTSTTGYVRDTTFFEGGERLKVGHLWNALVENNLDRALVTLTLSNGESSFENFGHWIYRDVEVSAVPIPAAAFMFAPALVGLLGLRRKFRF